MAVLHTRGASDPCTRDSRRVQSRTCERTTLYAQPSIRGKDGVTILTPDSRGQRAEGRSVHGVGRRHRRDAHHARALRAGHRPGSGGRDRRGHARRCPWRAGKSDRDQQTARGARCEVERPVVCSDDAVHDGQPEADAGMLVRAYPLSSASEGFGEGRYEFGSERMAHVLDLQHADVVLLVALRRAAADAADEGVELLVDSGWRSPEYQQQLLDEAVLRYGSEEEAARWVATADTSAHVSADAVDVGPSAAAWLSQHGAEYGLCQIYGNEPWHYELRPEAGDQGCPAMCADPTHDPRAAAVSNRLPREPCERESDERKLAEARGRS